MLRWWDGRQWTPALLPRQPSVEVPGPPPMGPPVAGPRPPGPRPTLPHHAGRNRHLGLIAILTRSVLLIIGAGLGGHALAVPLREFLGVAEALASGTTPVATELPVSALVQMMIALLLLVVSSVPLAFWTHRCATAGAALGIPAMFPPILSAVGWIVPALSVWLGYQGVLDSLPPRHPARRNVVVWWITDVVLSNLVVTVAVALALLGTAQLVVGLTVVAAVALATDVFGLRAARDIDDTHRAALNSVDHEVINSRKGVRQG